MEYLAQLATEARNPATANLDALSTADLVHTLHAADGEARLPTGAAAPARH
jgi:N-acetylmuramic acid 6-phosphate (MurNAc-6-P) etherase